MKELWIALLAVLCNASAQAAIKWAGAAGRAAYFSPWLMLAVVLYGASFFLTVRVFAANSLSIASPIMAGATFLLIGLAATLLFGEPMPPAKILGMALIVAGIALLALST